MSKSLRVLIVEDSEADTLLLLRHLRQGGFEPSYRRVETASAMQAALTAQAWDVIISDYRLPQFSGPEALQLLQTAGLDLPFILVSGAVGEELAVAMMKAGAHDFLLKDKLTRLVPAVERELREAASRRQRVQSEAALQEKTHFLQRTLNVMPGVIHVFDLEKQCSVFMNRTVETVLGYSPADLLALGSEVIAFLMHPDDLSQFKLHLQAIQSLADNEIRSFEFRMRDRAGSWHWFESRDSVFARNTEGKVTQLIGTALDITARKQMEEALRASEERIRNQHRELESIYDSAPIGLCLLDRDLRYVRINNRLAEINGFPVAEHLGRNVAEIVPSLLPTIHEVTQQILTTRAAVCNHEFCGETNSQPGVTRTWNESWFPVRNQEGTIIGFGIVVEEITERKQAEEALAQLNASLEQEVAQRTQTIREREERLQAILHTATDAIITINDRGTIIDMNPATEQLFGYSQTELMGQNVKFLMPQPYRDEHDSYLDRYLRTGEARLMGRWREFVAQRKDGSSFPIGLAVNKVNSSNVFTGIVRDITEQRNLQRQVLEIAADEQRRIGQELHDGTGQELTGLALFASTLEDLLARKPKSSNSQPNTWILDSQALERLRNTAKRITQGLMESHRHVQQLSHGIMPVQIDAQGLMSALAELTSKFDSPGQLHCHFLCPATVALHDNTSATHLYRIAQEAMNNSLRHGRATEIQISLLQMNGNIVLEISDNGCGFNPQSFQRARTPGINRGFGLEIMNYRAAILGGTLHISSGEIDGTKVKCTLPVRDLPTESMAK
jgi:two-component system, LuxR family, sensor kinase FixL